MAVPYGKVVGADQTLFVIEAVATQSGKLSEMMLLDDNFGAEVYTGEKNFNDGYCDQITWAGKADAFAADQDQTQSMEWIICADCSVASNRLAQIGK